MTWLLIPLRLLLAGSARYLDGSDLTYPRILTNALLGLLAGWTAWDATNNLIAAAVVCVNAGVCITLGQTKWESWKWQTLRGGFFGLLQIVLLTYLVAPILWQSALGMFLCYTLGYVAYYGVDKIKTPIGHFEQWARIIQGTLICFSASLL